MQWQVMCLQDQTTDLLSCLLSHTLWPSVEPSYLAYIQMPIVYRLDLAYQAGDSTAEFLLCWGHCIVTRTLQPVGCLLWIACCCLCHACQQTCQAQSDPQGK